MKYLRNINEGVALDENTPIERRFKNKINYKMIDDLFDLCLDDLIDNGYCLMVDVYCRHYNINLNRRIRICLIIKRHNDKDRVFWYNTAVAEKNGPLIYRFLINKIDDENGNRYKNEIKEISDIIGEMYPYEDIKIHE